MTLYKSLYAISSSMVLMNLEDDWDAFYQAEKKRQDIINRLEAQSPSEEVDATLLNDIIGLHQQIEAMVAKQQGVTQKQLLALQKGKKVNNAYQC